MNLILTLGIILISGHLGGWAAAKLKFPRITGYLVAGFLLNPSALHLIPKTAMESLELIPLVVLGVIAYHIGGGLRLRSMQHLGKAIVWISLGQSLLPWILSIFLIAFLWPLFMDLPKATFMNTYFPMAFVLGAVACSSAPAAIVAIIHEGKAKGPVTTTTLAVLALTDAFAVFAFAIAVGIAQPLANGDGHYPFYTMIVVPLLHLAEAALLGLLFGGGLLLLSNWVRTRSLLRVLVLGAILLCVGVAEHWGISSIAANMVAGFVVTNRAKRDDMFQVIEEVEDVLFTVFFVLNGIFFDLTGMKNAGTLTLFVIIARWGGKYFGARIGGRIARAPEPIAKFPGLVLLPKAGLTLGLAFMVRNLFPPFGTLMFDALIASTMINMLITPPLAKYALSKAKEAQF
jgi:Kef-type K+ transport system membrane component KefB